MKHVSITLLLLASVVGTPTLAAQNTVKLKIRAALYDRDLNLKPIPHLVKLVSVVPGVEPVAVQTSLEGRAIEKILDEKQIERIWGDFEPYRRLAAKAEQSPAQ